MKRYQQQHEQENVLRRGLITISSRQHAQSEPHAQHKTQ